MGSFEVLRIRDFRLVFLAAAVSWLGDGMAPLGLTFAVLDLTGSATDLGIVLGAFTLGLLGSLLVGGVVADRLSRRAVMVNADLTRFVVRGAIGILLVTGEANVTVLAISQLLVGAATGFFNPASTGLLPSVAGEHLQQGNSLRSMVSAGGSIVGPALAGVLVAATNPGVTLIADGVSYGISAILLLRVNRDLRAAGTPGTGFWAELRDGFAEVRSRTWLWSVVLAASVINAVAVGFVVLGAVIVKRHLGGAGAWALILAAQGVGALMAGTGLLRFRFSRPLLVACLVGLLPVAETVLVAIPTPLATIAVAALLAGVGSMAFNTLWETTLQQHIPEAARSRVSSYDWFGSLALSTLGYALVGPLAGAIGTSTALYLCAGVELLAMGALLLVGDLRHLPPTPAETSS
ncbi:MAG TPA: MFS transporter [Solirubrobacteraceae bacterium]|jgi:MFS family permease|nr:MFS transporter [Solirubrobacteraceae bacterium]